MTNILEITLSNILLKIWFRIEIKFQSDFKTNDIFPNMESNNFGNVSTEFWFRIKSNTDLNESGCFLLTLLNLKQYIITKLNV
jgi:hypothetical protein